MRGLGGKYLAHARHGLNRLRKARVQPQPDAGDDGRAQAAGLVQVRALAGQVEDVGGDLHDGVALRSTALDYENSHHNWFDHAFAENAAEERYELEIKFQPPGQDPLVEWVWTYTLRGKNAAGGALFADELLDLVSGRP